jgi:Uma2 family endonuclease
MTTAVIDQPTVESAATRGGSLMEARRRITVEEYHRIVDSGAFGPEPRVELLEGVIVEKTNKTPSHIIATDLVGDLFHHLVPQGSGYFTTMGNPVTIEDRNSEPEPDAGIYRGSIRDALARPRTPADAALLTEVSDTSYNYDRYAKWVTYAAARVSVYWIVDLRRRQLEIHTEPTGEGEAAVYARTQILGPDDEVTLTLDGREMGRFLVKEILP